MPIAGLPGGDFSGCVREMTGKVDDPKAFCAWKVHELTGKWPAEESINATSHYFEAQLSALKEPTGKEWDITIIGAATLEDLLTVRGVEYIRSANGRLYTTDGLRRSAPDWEGVKVYDNHLTDKEFKERAGMRSFLTEGVGVLTEPHWNESRNRLDARLVIVDDAAAKKLKNAWDEEVLEHIGLSVDTLTQDGPTVTYESKRYPSVEAFEHIISVDIVSEPAAGGRFNRLIAARQNQEVDMEITKELVMEWIAEALAAAAQVAAPGEVPAVEQVEVPPLEEVAPGEVTPEEAAEVVAEEVADEIIAAVEEVVAEADTPVEAAELMAEVIVEVAEEVVEEVVEEIEEIEEAPAAATEARLRRLESKIMLRDMLDAAKLPPGDRRIVEAAFAGRTFTRAALDIVIKRAKEAQARRDPSGQVRGSGQARLTTRGVMTGLEKAEIAFMQLMGQQWGGLRRLESNEADYVKERMPESLRRWVNAGRPNYRPRRLSNWLYDFIDGSPFTMRAKEANDVASITKNAVNLFLAADYSIREEWWLPIVTEIEVDTIDDVTLVRAYGFDNLAIVLEGQPYTPIELQDDEETGEHLKYGNYVGVTLETMLRDKLNVLQSIPKRLADSWYNTQSALVSAVFTLNAGVGPTLSAPDSGALFNATAATTVSGHANLTTAALSFTAWGAQRDAMRKQTVMRTGAGRRALIEPKFLLAPVDLETTGLQIRNSEFQTLTANNDINPYYQTFEVIVVPDWVDTDNWATVADPIQHPAIYTVYVRGHRVPQIYTAGDEESGAVFTNDTWRYKVRLMTYRFSSTDTCAPVSDFRPLHKINVSQ